jgi:tetratricopeptide (TPR) repeat protein
MHYLDKSSVAMHSIAVRPARVGIASGAPGRLLYVGYAIEYRYCHDVGWSFVRSAGSAAVGLAAVLSKSGHGLPQQVMRSQKHSNLGKTIVNVFLQAIRPMVSMLLRSSVGQSLRLVLRRSSKLPMWLLLGLLASCATTRQEAVDVAAARAEPEQLSPAGAVTKAASQAVAATVPPDYPVAAFEGDALYQLLVAEVAGYRGDYATALTKYMAMTVETRDPGVAARATRLAVYVKDDAAAMRAAQVWSEVEPDNLDAQRYAASQLIKAGDLEGAIVHMAAIKALGGAANFDIFAYRSAELEPSERDGLLRAISRMLEDYPADPQLLFSQAVLLEQSDRYEEALQIAEQLLAGTPGPEQNINVVILKVNILKNLKRLTAAQEFLEERLTGTNESRRLRLIYARLLFENERLTEAREQYDLVLAEVPNDGDILFALALICLEQEDDDAARGYLQQMLRWNLRVGEAHFYLGNIAEKQADTFTAIREYRQAGQGYEYLPAQSRLGALLIGNGQVAEASAHFENERTDHPEQYERLILVEAQLLNERDLSTDLFALLDRSLAENPENIDLLYYRAMAGERFGRIDILERDLNTVLDLDPENADAMNALGYTLADRTDRYDEALQLIQRALALKPNEAAFIDSLGWVQYRLKNYAEAALHLHRALALFDNDEVAAHLSEVLWVMGRQAEARAVLNKALQAAPDSPKLQQVLELFTP